MMKIYLFIFLFLPFCLFSQWEKRIKVEVNPKIEAVISETLAMPYEFGDDDKATLRGLAIMSAESLRAVWDTPEEDAAWQYLQPVTS